MGAKQASPGRLVEVYFQLNLPSIPYLTISTEGQGDDAAQEGIWCDSYLRVGRDPIPRDQKHRRRISRPSPRTLHVGPAPSTLQSRRLVISPQGASTAQLRMSPMSPLAQPVVGA